MEGFLIRVFLKYYKGRCVSVGLGLGSSPSLRNYAKFCHVFCLNFCILSNQYGYVVSGSFLRMGVN